MIDDTETIDRQAPDLFEAARNDDLDEYHTALKHGADLNDAKGNGRTAIHFCAMHGAMNVLKAAIGHPDFDPWIRDAGGLLPIDHALAKDYTEIYNMLYDAMYPPGWFLEKDDVAES